MVTDNPNFEITTYYWRNNMENEPEKSSQEHVPNIYTQDANGDITYHTNRKGSSDVAGTDYSVD